MSDHSMPHWDMSVIFPSLESPEFRQALEAVLVEIGGLERLFDDANVRRGTAAEDAAFVRHFEQIVDRLNALLNRLETLHTYIGCFATTDATNETARACSSTLDTHSIRLNQLQSRFVAWVGTCDLDRLLEESETARSHEFYLRQAQHQAQHQMSEAEESLAAELLPPGLIGWARLHGNISAMLTAPVRIGDVDKILPMSEIRSLANHADRDVRKAAYEAEIAAWEKTATPLAAALNGIKGYQRTLRQRRGYANDVEPTYSDNSVDRETVEAMQAACAEVFPDFQRYFRAKAKALGLERLAWCDLNAPLGQSTQTWSWEAAEAFILQHFGAYSDRMRAFAERSFQERWIDAEPRIGKEGGAYCSSVLPGVSRVMMNFDGSFMGVSTLAHELGHAYHNLILETSTPLQRSTPSTLAETASIFCETIVFNAALVHADREERIALLDTTVQRDLLVVVDIHSRFLFEKAVFERRAERDLTVQEFNALMTEAQLATYGDEMETLHPYMWAVKGHYYGPTFYNYPYTFGLLFGLGLYAQYEREPASFRTRYDEFLSSTGLADAATLADRFGVDVHNLDFWRASLDVIRRTMRDLESLIQ